LKQKVRAFENKQHMHHSQQFKKEKEINLCSHSKDQTSAEKPSAGKRRKGKTARALGGGEFPNLLKRKK